MDTQSQDGPVIHELIDLTHAIIECVNHGILVRGGMTIGPVHIGSAGKGPIFGDAMVRAYEIEENEAIYPRIMIDDQALETYLSDKSLWQDGQFSGDEARMATSYISVADDGSYFIDYLKAADPGTFDEGVAGYFVFLQRHRDLILGNLDAADAKARRKLVWLANYHNRFTLDLQKKYSMTDPDGLFERTTGCTPINMFKNLMIEVDWASAIATLHTIAAGKFDSRKHKRPQIGK